MELIRTGGPLSSSSTSPIPRHTRQRKMHTPQRRLRHQSTSQNTKPHWSERSTSDRRLQSAQRSTCTWTYLGSRPWRHTDTSRHTLSMTHGTAHRASQIMPPHTQHHVHVAHTPHDASSSRRPLAASRCHFVACRRHRRAGAPCRRWEPFLRGRHARLRRSPRLWRR